LNHIYYLSMVIIAKCAGCETSVVAVGVDPIQGRFNRFWTRFVLEHWADHVSVRDEPSREALIHAGVNEPIDIVPDPVFELSIPREGPHHAGIVLALSPRRDRPQWSEEMAYLCDRLSGELAIPIDLLVFFPPQDEAFSREIARYSSGVRRVRVWQDPTDLLGWIPEYQLVVATRFHALVLAAMHHVPFIGWGRQKKVAWLCQTFKKPYRSMDEEWNFQSFYDLVVSEYKSVNKSVILQTQIG